MKLKITTLNILMTLCFIALFVSCSKTEPELTTAQKEEKFQHFRFKSRDKLTEISNEYIKKVGAISTNINEDEVKEIKECMKLLDSAIKYNSNNDTIYYNYSLAFYWLNDISNAMKMIDKSLEIKEDNFSLRHKANLLSRQGQYEMASNYYGKCLKYSYNKEDTIKINIYMAQLLEKIGNTMASIECYKNVLEKDSVYFTALFNISQKYISISQYKIAQKYVDKLMNLYNDSSASYFVDGELYRSKRQYIKAINRYNQALNIDTNIVYFIKRASCEQLLNRSQDALKDYEIAKKIDRTERYARDIIYGTDTINFELFGGNNIVTLYNNKEYKKVIELCNSILKDNSNISALHNRANSYYHLGMYNEAKTDYQKLLEIDHYEIIGKQNINGMLQLVEQSDKK